LLRRHGLEHPADGAEGLLARARDGVAGADRGGNAVCRGEVRGRAAEDPRDRLRAIVAERLADDLPERPERDAVAVREALTLEHTRCVGDRVGELARELRLPDARGGENREQLRRALADAAL